MQLASADSTLGRKSCDKGDVEGSGAGLKDVTLMEKYNAAFTPFLPPPMPLHCPQDA